MSPLRTASRGTATSVPGDLDRRLAGLRRAVEACDAHLDAAHVPPLAHAHAVLTRAGERLGLGAGLTVAALAGATGSGKSSTFNALAGAEVSTVGVRRPTTSATSAALWCPEAVAAPLLDWLAVPSRHVVLPGADGGEGSSDPLHGLVLLDLPDHDSTQATHRAEVDRVVGLADVLVWVLDPQKYADALVHEEYLQPWAGHGVVTVVALNQVDRVGADDLEPVLADLRRLLDDDGLREAELLAVSARTGEGLADLRALLAQRVTSTRAAQVRLAADVARSATALAEAVGTEHPAHVSDAARTGVTDACADAAGVPTVVEAVRKAATVRGRRATGWPVTSWLSRLKPDPLRRLHLGAAAVGRLAGGRAGGSSSAGGAGLPARTSLPTMSGAQRTRVEAGVRRVVHEAAADLREPWALAVRRAATARSDDLVDGLDRAVGSVDLGRVDPGGWTRAVRGLQWLLLLTAVAGALWLGLLVLLGYLQVPEPATPRVGPLPVPTALLLGGVLAGLLLALLCRGLVALGAARRARAVEARLRAEVGRVVDELVLAPVDDVLAGYRASRDGLHDALG